MNIYEDEQLEKVLEEITTQLGYIFLDLILMSLKKIRAEENIFAEFLDAKLECNTDSKTL